MAAPIESYFVVIERDDDGNEGEEYLASDLVQLAKKYAPRLTAEQFEETALKLDPWTFGVSIRRATKKDAPKFQEDEELRSAVYEYTHMDDYVKERNAANADIILFTAYERVKDEAGLVRFLELTKLTTSQLEALNRKASSAVKAPDGWLDIFAGYVASKATTYKNKAGDKTKRTKESILSDWKGINA